MGSAIELAAKLAPSRPTKNDRDPTKTTDQAMLRASAWKEPVSCAAQITRIPEVGSAEVSHQVSSTRVATPGLLVLSGMLAFSASAATDRRQRSANRYPTEHVAAAPSTTLKAMTTAKRCDAATLSETNNTPPTVHITACTMACRNGARSTARCSTAVGEPPRRRQAITGRRMRTPTRNPMTTDSPRYPPNNARFSARAYCTSAAGSGRTYRMKTIRISAPARLASTMLAV